MLGAPWLFGGLTSQSSSRSWDSAGLLFVVFPFVSVVSVDPTPPLFLPGPSNVVQVTVPRSFVQLSGSGAATAVDIAPPKRKPDRVRARSALRMVMSLVCLISRKRIVAEGSG